MKIAMVSEHASPIADMGGEDAGGQNVHVAQLAAALTRQGHRVSVYTRRDRPDLAERVEAPEGYEVVHVEAGPAGRVPKDHLLPHMGAFAERLRALWDAEPPDIAHAHFWMSGLASLWAADEADLPVVQTYHALGTVKRRHQGEADTSPPSRLQLERDIGARCAGVIATCRDEVDELAAMDVDGDKVEVIPCGVDLEHFNPDGPAGDRTGRRRVVTAGRLVPRKGVDTAIKALRDLRGTELVVAGGPAEGPVEGDPEARRLRRVAEEAGVADRVLMPGRVPHEAMPAQFRSADAVVCTPWYEPFGIVPLEAMACGVPVVASAVGGMIDSVEDGVTGTLVPDPSPEAVAEALRPYLEDAELGRRTGQAGRERACALYSWDAIAAETIKAYELAAS
ncbi:glycosyltransferase [Glycomyces arizonensis]|uniref:glycosyltransferase n=1 Tax=Glycomyces arizonensis TaxID=256035 RepID=UPI000421EC04|nr:glycosyltransferase [Glycomyces arizonensis]